jgi:hypothetical protein
VQTTHAHFANEVIPIDLNPSEDPDIQEAKRAWLARYRLERANEEAANVRKWLTTAITGVKALKDDDAVRAMRDFRDQYIAHNLDLPEPEIGQETDVRRMRYGDETRFLDKTVEIVDTLHLALNGTSFNWDDA